LLFSVCVIHFGAWRMHVRWENGEAVVIWAYTMRELSLDDDDDDG
jgi:hypothetical protein